VNVQIPFQPLISFMETVQKTGALRLLPSQLKEF
jgi:hypothetical protein